MPFVEIVEPLDRLAPNERQVLTKAFELRHSRDRGDEYVLKPGVSGRAVTAAVRIIDKLRKTARLPLPEHQHHRDD